MLIFFIVVVDFVQNQWSHGYFVHRNGPSGWGDGLQPVSLHVILLMDGIM